MVSVPANIKLVEGFVEKLIGELRINSQHRGNILISVTEAVTNAILHGNASDETKKVRVYHALKENELFIEVQDEGCGFDFDTLPDPTEPENILKLGGRGVFLMEQLSDGITFMEDGCKVCLKFSVSLDEPQ